MKEKGSVFGEKTPEQIRAIEMLKPNIEKIRSAANLQGKTVERYLLDRKLNPRVAYELHKMAVDLQIIEPIEPTGEVEEVTTKKPSFNEFFLDIIKWGLILIMAGLVFYVVCPKYYFTTSGGVIPVYKCNKITGQVSQVEIK